LCVGFDLDATKRQLLVKEGASLSVIAADDVKSFVTALETPRKIMLLVPAGPIVDSVINDLKPLLQKGDILIDGGNSHFSDTERRESLLNSEGFEFLGVGVSGGEEGARHGASIMIGGKPEVYEHVRPMLEAASAKVNGEPCAAHVGHGSAGHFVKMVHNGIEYGLLQAYAEGYEILHASKTFPSLDLEQISSVWQHGSVVRSWLNELAAAAFARDESLSGIKGWVADSGEGRWTVQEAIDLDVPAPVITLSLLTRFRSRQDDSYGAKVLAALRNEFGGHAVKTE